MSCLLEYYERNEYREAKCTMCTRSLGAQFCVEFYRRQLERLEQASEQNDSQVAFTLVNLGNSYGSLGDVEKKKELLERALAIQEREYGPGHREVATTLPILGTLIGL